MSVPALLTAVAVLLLLAALCSPVFADYPSHRGTALNDFAGVVDKVHASKIEALSREILEKTGTSIVVVTMQAIGENEDINRYVNGLYTAWGIGTKGEDRGLLIFLAMEERRVRIETGYGVEGILPDGLVGEILDEYVVPYLQSGEVGRALYNAVYACGAYVAHDAGVELTGVSSSTRTRSVPENGNVNWPGLIFLLIAATVLLGTKQGRRMLPWIMLLLLMGGRGRGGGMGGGFGGGFGGFGGGMSGGGGAGRGF